MKKILILLTALCLVLCGCSKNEKQTDNTNEELSQIAEKLDLIADALSEDQSVADPEDDIVFDEEFSEEYPTDEQQKTSGSNSSSSSSKNTSSKSSSGSKTSTTAKSVPTSTEEIVKYFSDSANAVKKDKPGFTITETPTVGDVQIGKGSSTLVNAIKSAAMTLVKPSEKSAKKGEDHSVFPVEGKSWACKLDASFVKKAECNKSGNYYVISIYLKDETLSALPKNQKTATPEKFSTS